MRLLCDENIHSAIVRWLREQGYDVRYVAEDSASSSDRQVLTDAASDHRIIVTDDKDFGELAIRHQLASVGVILIRLSAAGIKERLARLSSVWDVVASNAPGNLVIVGDSKVRVRELHR